jgi:hypothetical protein
MHYIPFVFSVQSKVKLFSLNKLLYLLQKQLHVSAIAYSHDQAVYMNKMEIFTVTWLEISKPYSYCYTKIRNAHNVGRKPWE